MNRYSGEAQGDRPTVLDGTRIIHFGIFCCLITMVIVAAVALSTAR